MSKGWIQLRRTADTFELLKEKNVFHLLTSIALRAKRTTDFNVEGLKPGEALIGDHRNYEMTRQEYRTAKKKLERWRFATFRTTNKGTIAKLIDKRIYDINEESQQPPEQPSTNHQTTNQQPSRNHQSTTNKNDKNKKEYSPESVEFRLSQFLLDLILERKPNFRKPDLQGWAVYIDRLIHLDKRSPEQLEAVIHWCQQDDFWQNNILSTEKLRKQIDKLELAMEKTGEQEYVKPLQYDSGGLTPRERLRITLEKEKQPQRKDTERT